MKAQSPSGGDGLAIGEQLTMEEQLGLRGGFSRLLQGTQADPSLSTQGIGVALTTDRGYIFVPNNMGGDNINFMAWCRENNVLLLHPFRYTFHDTNYFKYTLQAVCYMPDTAYQVPHTTCCMLLTK